MGQLTLLLAFHNHQPDGNFDHVFAQGYADCYGPLLRLLAEFPKVRCALHHTGALLEWLERHQPEYIALLRELAQKNQIEIMGGGFYEPMLAVLPDRDAVGQIEMMNQWCEAKLGVRPQGMWLAERVWEPALAQLIGGTGLRYTLTDDTHFRNAGWLGELSGYYVTEKAGTPLAIFPIAKELRYAIPFKSPEQAMQVLYDMGDAAGSRKVAATYGDDGEKFGMWPGTKEWVWDKGWLRKFFTLLSEAPPERVRTGLLREALTEFPPSGRVYLPTASYYEMGEWSLPADAQARLTHAQHVLDAQPTLKEEVGPFVRGGLWQNFLAKYPEAHFMHKKMIRVSDKLAAAERHAGATPGHDGLLDEARRELYRAQTNCGYWHGLFGGLYLNYIRHAVYTHLIAAEEIADRVAGTAAGTSARALDLDADLRDELELTSDKLRVYIKPDEGGAVYELDVRKQRMNLLNVMGRRREAYHDKLRSALEQPHGHGHDHGHGGGQKSIHDLVIVKDRTLGELLTYDRHLKLGFVDHFVPEGTRLEELARGSYRELGDFAAGRYEVRDLGAQDSVASVTLWRRGSVGGVPVELEKRLRLEGGQLSCSYRVRAEGHVDALFGSEIAFTLLAGHDDKRRYRELPGSRPGLDLGATNMASHGELAAAPGLEAIDEWLGLRVTLKVTPEARLCRFPLETASQSEGGFERTFQGSALLPLWRVTLEAGQTLETRASLDIGDL